ncbi:MAG: GNAT family N-acetyltransferase [Marinilabiliales bacterium]|nr:MAG: GNAT family N-acetyltransferase [Marinilabiliales bacterium]
MEKYLEILKRDSLKNISIINFIENNQINGVEKVENSFIVRGKSDRDWVYIACPNQEELTLVKDRLTEKDTCFGAIEEWMIPTITKNHEILWNLALKQFYLPDEICFPAPKHQIKNLSQRDAETIYVNSDYKEFLSIEYIEHQIKKGPGKGIFKQDKLVAWGLTQDDGAMGFLHVLDEERKKGYGYSITISLIKEIRKTGKIPFVYIEHTNKKSLNLISKLGFIRQKDCQWFEIK